ncbi:hypothetical protein EDB92DRAFT_2061794 [Lactarius akahatsu]|uniref:Integral membrane protein n=1 Tax=Lactarius akahatsu TaxID=416441 RepID=A0AAD4QGH2_9AGAM|nr:hypothetical protein EDB92DRAFT_2061794 [Lactarius akahatsu]
MRLVPLPPNLKLVWDRVTASRIATIYFVFSILHCAVQVVFQVQAFSVNKQAADFLSGLIHTGDAALSGFFVLGSQLHFCDHVPNSLSTDSCRVVWNGTIGGTGDSRSDGLKLGSGNNATLTFTSSITPTSSLIPSSTSTRAHSSSTPRSTSEPHLFTSKRAFAPKPQIDIANFSAIALNGQTGVTLQGFGFGGKNVTLDNKCLVALNWPVQTLKNTKREDIAFINFQLWVLGMSLVALLNESIPHIIASTFTHLSATAWGAFQIYNTDMFHQDFKRLTTDGACKINLLPSYWEARARAEIPSLAFSAAALLVSCYLSFKLVKAFGWQTFKRVGASRTINKIYKLILTLSIVIQLSLFFVVTAVALWLDQLCNGAIAVMATQSKIYEIFLVIVLTLLIPWLLMGWFASRRELKYPMAVFLVLSALYVIGWGLMFDSTTFRWTFVQWTFFASMATLSAVLAIIDLIVGIMCRLNFDKGLPNYLNAQEPLADDSFIQARPAEGNAYDEKVDFPSTVHPVPTFSAAFKPSTEFRAPGQTGLHLGPRFFNRSAAPSVQHVDVESLSAVHPASPESVNPGSTQLVRAGSQYSTSSSSTVTTTESVGRSRWVIE